MIEEISQIIQVVKIYASGPSLEFQTRYREETPKEVSAVFPVPVSVELSWTANGDRSHP